MRGLGEWLRKLLNTPTDLKPLVQGRTAPDLRTEPSPEHTWPLKACRAAPFLKARMRGLKRKKLIVCFNKEVKKKK